MVRGLISERSYPWAVEPAGLNGSIRHRFSGEGSGGEAFLPLGWRLVAPEAPTYFISTIFRTERKSPARNPYRYTPVATLAPEASRPSHSNS